MKITLNMILVAVVVTIAALLAYTTVQKYVLDAKNAQG